MFIGFGLHSEGPPIANPNVAGRHLFISYHGSQSGSLLNDISRNQNLGPDLQKILRWS